MQRKALQAPFALTTLILLFGKKKQPEQTRDQPSERETFPVPDNLKKTITGNDLTKARDRLRIANLERDIIGDALTKIYEAESRGQINESEKNTLLQRYKTDLKRVDSDIDTHKKTVDLYELESAKEELLKSFQEKMLEIDLKIRQIRPTVTLTTLTPETKTVEQAPAKTEPTTPQNTAPKEKQARERPKNKAEERIDSIREEVLQAMERLEQIESEG